MQNILVEYLPILIFLGIAFGLALVIIIASLIAGPSRPDPEKTSAYECGFEAFDDARSKFDVRFYLVAILFIVFDLEAAFLFPVALGWKHLQQLGPVILAFIGFFLFFFVLGLWYEYKVRALDWER